MNNYTNLVTSFLIALTLSALSHAVERPNVILIMTDDQGYGDFGVMGNELIDTPNFDAMAGRSASMSTFYVHPVCSPTRASLMTGRYNQRTRCIDTNSGHSMMDPAEVTVAEILRDAGYATGIFGKWHLGDSYPMRAIDQGFEEALIHRGGGLAQPSDHPENGGRYTDPWLYHNGEPVKTKGFCTDVYFSAAMEYIKEQKAANKPFFTYIATNAPHDPLHDVPKELIMKYLKRPIETLHVPEMRGHEIRQVRGALARIFAMIENTDQNMGRLFTFLDEEELTENTLVIYLNDNGPWTMRYVGPFRGNKTNVMEGSLRSPLWLQWPAKFKAGSTRDNLSANIDVMPTILEACGVDVPKDLKLDGRSLLPVLENKDANWPERNIVMQAHRGTEVTPYRNFMIRNNRWKLVNPGGFHKLNFEDAPKFELYDLQNDPGETINLVKAKPEIAKGLQAGYDAWFDDVSSTRENNYAAPIIQAGTPHENPTALTHQDSYKGNPRYWNVEFPEEHIYDITVHLYTKFKEEEGNLKLNIGEMTYTSTVPVGAKTIDLTQIMIPAGTHTLTASVQYGGNSTPPYQLELLRR